MTLLGGGPVAAEDLDAVLQRAPGIIAADGGADTAAELGRASSVQAVIGDLDSLTSVEPWRKSGVPVHRITEQNTTDFEKCLYSCAAPLLLGVGFLGGRLDHAWAVLNTLVRRRAGHVVLVGESDVVFLCPELLALDLPEGARVSIVPMAPVRGTVSEGLRWSVAGLELAPAGQGGTSNRALGGPLRLAFDAPGALIFLERRHLGAAVTACLVNDL